MKNKLNFTKPLNLIFMGIITALVVICLFVTRGQWREIYDSYHDNNETHLHNINSYLNDIFDNYKYSLYGVVKSTTGLSMASPEQKIKLRKRLMDQLYSIPHISGISLGDLSGNYIRVPQPGVNPEELANFDPRTRPWFSNPSNNSNEIAFTDPYKDLALKKKIISLSLPVLDENSTTQGVIALDIDYTFLLGFFNRLEHPVEGSVFILTSNGQEVLKDISLQSPEIIKKIFNKVSTSDGYFYLEDNDSYYYHKTLSNPDWVIFYRVSKEKLDNIVLNETLRVTYGATFALIIALFAWWIINTKINNIYLAIANGLRYGDLKNKKASDMLLDEIKHTAEHIVHMTEEVQIDGLTGLLNRRAFDKDLKRVNASEDCFIAMVDIDNFKSINDTYGHQTGDAVLKSVATLGMIHESDDITLYRYGGEEIAAIMKGVTRDEAFTIIDAWRSDVEKRKYREPGLKTTFSAGLCDMAGGTASEALAKADALLYAAKRAGKNRVCTRVDS